MSNIIWIIVVIAAYLMGLKTLRLYGYVRYLYYHLKLGICFRYLPTGKRETRGGTRGGTRSDFCQRCGHPAGYHK